MRKILLIISVVVLNSSIFSQELVPQTYCNPLDIDYTYSILYTDDPKGGKWTPTASITNNIQDSELFKIKKSTSTDDDFVITEMPLKKTEAGEILSEVLTDESPKSFWVADSNDDLQWVKIEMLNPGKIYAFQLNFHDHESGIYTRTEGLRQRNFRKNSN